MTRRNADEGEGRRDGRTAAAREERAVEQARAEREGDRGDTVDQDTLPDLPNSADLRNDEADMDDFQMEGQRKDAVGSNVRGGADVPIAGEQYVGAEGILDSTNAVTARARAVLVDNPIQYTAAGKFPIRSMGDVKAAVFELVGTQNTKAGKTYTAIKSTKFSFPNGRGTRAAVAHKDGSITLLAGGVTYDQWYAAIHRHQQAGDGAIGLIFRFDQSLEAKNPFLQCDVYEMKNLPQVAVEEEIAW